MHSSEAVFLLILVLGAYIAPILSRKLMFPPSVGEVLFGIAIAPIYHRIMHTQDIINFMAELGFLILMYLAGLEVDFENIRSMRKKELMSYVASISIIAALSMSISTTLGQKPIMGVAYMTVAIGLLYPVLQDLKLLDKPEGQSLLVLGGIGEIFSLAGLTFMSLYYQYGVGTQALMHLLGLIAFVLTIYAFSKLFHLLIWWYPRISNVLTTTGTASEMGIRANFVNMFIFVAGAALIGIEPIIGAFIGGMLFSLLFRSKHDIQEIFSGVGNGFLIPIFFINVGLNFKISYLANTEVIIGAVLISILLLLIRYLSMIHFLFTGVSFRLFMIAPVALSFPLTLMVTVAMFGMNYKVITETEAAMLIISALLTAIVYPMLTKTLAKRF
ncbi:sodium/hydrogen exchanger [Denitrovibrio acetiphilus DSM 12809]|uniref:Sodium/hydrogen exchanger n=1 Tax=Denitrovibrio acetiphilus (strain DSM 12809 / NBRC 114555 / N2460) TaxID=522772 RepID=D4H142_DENA2|nr:cation:proton antiporter [Denitrovibrio acetiphilus]ADD68705.1 sodium/hydrogen exchanger [Denitrovibrio acetiphilus DSM 12809]